MTTEPRTEYRCLIGFSHEPKNAKPLRFEPGDLVTGVPIENCRALAEAGVLEPVTPAKSTTKRKHAQKASV